MSNPISSGYGYGGLIISDGFGTSGSIGNAPTVTGISPLNGPTRGGNIVTINGTGFRLGGALIWENGIVKSRKSISVQFDGVESDYAYPITENKVIARVPQYRGNTVPSELTIRLANLDDDQVEIDGESVEFESYTVERPRLTLQPIDLRVMEQFLKGVRRHVHPNVWFTTERRYWDMSEGVMDPIREQATLPLIHVNGMVQESNTDQQGMGGEQVEVSPGVWETFANGESVDIVLSSIEIYSRADHMREIVNLARGFMRYVTECPYLRVDPEDWDAGAQYEYQMIFPEDAMPSYETGPQLDGFKVCRTGCIIKGIELRDPDEKSLDWTRDWNSLEIDFHFA